MSFSYLKQYNFILSLVDGYKLKMFIYFLLELFSIAMTLLFIFYSKQAIDVALKVQLGNLNSTLIIVVAFALGNLIIRFLSQLINQQTQIHMTQNFQFTILRKQMLSVWKVIKKYDTGDLMVRINSDCTEIVQMISNTWITFVLTCVKISASFFFLYYMDSMLALVILFISPIFILIKYFFRTMRDLNTRVKQAESQLGSVMQENLRYRIVLRALGIIESRFEFFKKKQLKYSELRLKYFNFTIISQSLMRSAMTIGYLIAFIWGIYRLQSAEISYGTMTAFLQLVSQIQSPILTLGAFFPAFVRFGVAADRINELLSVHEEPLLKGVHLNSIDSIEFDNVSFKYDDEIIINRLSFPFEKGKTTAIVGASGKGKTTLIRLLLGLIKANEGDILLNDNDVRIKLSTAHIENFSYVPQGNSLLSGTIRENISMGDVSISDGRIKEILYVSCAEFVYDLPQGLDTMLGESGLGLSEGQAQRVAIARALIRDRKVLLFDEATSALDENTTNSFLSRIKYLIDDKIVIFVTHDEKVVLSCHNQLSIS